MRLLHMEAQTTYSWAFRGFSLSPVLPHRRQNSITPFACFPLLPHSRLG